MTGIVDRKLTLYSILRQGKIARCHDTCIVHKEVYAGSDTFDSVDRILDRLMQDEIERHDLDFHFWVCVFYVIYNWGDLGLVATCENHEPRGCTCKSNGDLASNTRLTWVCDKD